MSGAAALALFITGSTGRWDPQRWKARFIQALPGRTVLIAPREIADPAQVAYAATWMPPAGAFGGLRNLRAIFNLGAGVDALMQDPSLPDLPIVRVVSADLTGRMSEYVLLHVLRYHRQDAFLLAGQRQRRWAAPDQWPARALRVGVMGLGVLGTDAARKLSLVGFDVAGWSRSKKSIAGIPSFAGTDELPAFLARTDVLVVLLPLTSDTKGFLDRRVFSLLARDGVLGGPVLINAARGGLQNEADILEALDNGTLSAATLDVFGEEPLPENSPFWTHPKVTITPHNAADSDPDVIAAEIAAQILAHERGEPLRNVIDRRSGY